MGFLRSLRVWGIEPRKPEESGVVDGPRKPSNLRTVQNPGKRRGGGATTESRVVASGVDSRKA